LSSNEANSNETALSCVRCQYQLTGLPMNGECPECGMPVAHSHSMRVRAGMPSRRIPSLKLLLTMILLSTSVGVPVIIAFAGASFIGQSLQVVQQARFEIAFLVLASLSLIIPLITILLVPGETRQEKTLLPSVTWLVVGIIGLGLCLMGMGLWWNGYTIIGMTLATIAIMLNLTRANRVVGNVIPDWSKLGRARQKKEPLLVAIILIMGGRLLVLGDVISLSTDGSMLQFWGFLAMVGLEVLLGIGGCYVMGNRVWMALKLFKSIQYGPTIRR